VDFVFVTSSKAAGPNNYGEIDVFEVNSESGFMRQIPTSPFPSGGRNPVAEAVSTDNTNLYVVNQDDNTIVQFVIGNDGKLYPQNTVNTPGSSPSPSPSMERTCLSWTPTSRCRPAPPRPLLGFGCGLSLTVGHRSPSDARQRRPIQCGNGLNYWPLSLPASGQRRDCAHGGQRSGFGRGRLCHRLRHDGQHRLRLRLLGRLWNNTGVR
jgi:6-phosphogluconolactonase